MTILVVAAHPDDEILGCGGTIKRLSVEGTKVFIAILGEGITSRFKDREKADVGLTDSLRSDCRTAAKLIGAEEVFLYDLPDNRFDSVPLLEVVKIIESIIDQVQPSVVYSHCGGDLNIDHVITHRAVLTATRPTGNCPVQDVYAFEVASSTDWALQQFHSAFRPTVFMDITETIEIKIRALQQYESEVRSFPHPRSPESLRINSKRWGTVVGLQNAEAFELIRSVR